MLVVAVVGIALATEVRAQSAPPLAGLLRPGTRLQYSSNGEAQPPWTVDSVTHSPALRPASQCTVIHLRRRPDQPRAEPTRLCLARDTLFAWDSTRQLWTPSRPAGPAMQLSIPRRVGGTVDYETTGTSVDTISGHVISVLLTTVTTRDSLGRAVRRLRERYALSLATATGGTFETPDSLAPGTWRSQQVFVLRAIERP